MKGYHNEPREEADILAQDGLLPVSRRGLTIGHREHCRAHSLETQNVNSAYAAYGVQDVSAKYNSPTPKGMRTRPVCNALYPYLSESVRAQVYTIEYAKPKSKAAPRNRLVRGVSNPTKVVWEVMNIRICRTRSD